MTFSQQLRSLSDDRLNALDALLANLAREAERHGVPCRIDLDAILGEITQLTPSHARRARSVLDARGIDRIGARTYELTLTRPNLSSERARIIAQREFAGLRAVDDPPPQPQQRLKKKRKVRANG